MFDLLARDRYDAIAFVLATCICVFHARSLCDFHSSVMMLMMMMRRWRKLLVRLRGRPLFGPGGPPEMSGGPPGPPAISGRPTVQKLPLL